MKIIIEVSGGCVTNIEASDDVSIYLVDHDNLESGQSVDDVEQASSPNFVGTDEEILERLEDTLSEYAKDRH